MTSTSGFVAIGAFRPPRSKVSNTRSPVFSSIFFSLSVSSITMSVSVFFQLSIELGVQYVRQYLFPSANFLSSPRRQCWFFDVFSPLVCAVSLRLFFWFDRVSRKEFFPSPFSRCFQFQLQRFVFSLTSLIMFVFCESLLKSLKKFLPKVSSPNILAHNPAVFLLLCFLQKPCGSLSFRPHHVPHKKGLLACSVLN